MTFYSVNWLFYDQRLQIKYNHIVVMPKLMALPENEVSGLVLKTPRSQLGHTQELLATVMLWLTDREIENLQK